MPGLSNKQFQIERNVSCTLLRAEPDRQLMICVDLRGLVHPHQGSEIKQATGTKWGHAVASWLRHYAVSRKVEGLRPVEVNFFSNLHKPSGHTRLRVYSASNRNEYQKQEK
jgi:hypothetical protein